MTALLLAGYAVVGLVVAYFATPVLTRGVYGLASDVEVGAVALSVAVAWPLMLVLTAVIGTLAYLGRWFR